MLHLLKDLDHSIQISSTGHYVPEKIRTNEELATLLNIPSNWIERRTLIKERRIAGLKESTSSLAAKAATNALKSSTKKPSDIDLLIVATSTPDTLVPSTACKILSELNLNNIPAFDLHSSCSGFIYALSVASSYINSGFAKNALIIASEIRSRVTNILDKDTISIYGDGAGALILSKKTQKKNGIRNFILGSDGKGSQVLSLPGNGNLHSLFDNKKEHSNDSYIKIHKKTQLAKYAINKITGLIKQSLEAEKISLKDIKLIIPHQMNGKIINIIAKQLKAPRKLFFTNLEKYGNTSAASIPIALDEALKQNLIKKNDYVLLVSFGAGITWGSTLIKW